MSEQRVRWADGACLRGNCASEASSLSVSGASLAEVRTSEGDDSEECANPDARKH